jgi:hypothetical protein
VHSLQAMGKPAAGAAKMVQLVEQNVVAVPAGPGGQRDSVEDVIIAAIGLGS